MEQLLTWMGLLTICQAEDDEEDEDEAHETLEGTTVAIMPQLARPIDPAELDQSTEVHEVHTDPLIEVAPKFLHDFEVDHLLQLVSERWVPSNIKDTSLPTEELKGYMSSGRTSWSAQIEPSETPIVQAFEERLSSLVGIDVSYLEKLVLVRYAPGQQYKTHHDGSFRPVTVFCYLNELPDNDEGETYFPQLNIKFVPRKGAAVVWSNTMSTGDSPTKKEDARVLHAGLPPKTAIKYGLNCFFNERVQRDETWPWC